MGHGLHPEKDDEDGEQNENDDEDIKTADSHERLRELIERECGEPQRKDKLPRDPARRGIDFTAGACRNARAYDSTSGGKRR